jgi:hypothetical protein
MTQCRPYLRGLHHQAVGELGIIHVEEKHPSRATLRRSPDPRQVGGGGASYAAGHRGLLSGQCVSRSEKKHIDGTHSPMHVTKKEGIETVATHVITVVAIHIVLGGFAQGRTILQKREAALLAARFVILCTAIAP